MVVAREFWKYEDMYTLFLGPQLVAIVINDFQRAKDLFSRDEFSGMYIHKLPHTLIEIVGNNDLRDKRDTCGIQLLSKGWSN